MIGQNRTGANSFAEPGLFWSASGYLNLFGSGFKKFRYFIKDVRLRLPTKPGSGPQSATLGT